MARDVEEGTNKGRHRSIPSPAFSHATPTHSISGPGSPEFSEAGFRRSSRPLSPDFSRASTDIGDNGYSERQQPGLEVVPQPPHKPKPGSREGQAGLEVNPESNYNKEAYRPDPALGAPEAVVAGDEKRERRFCGLRKRMFILLLVVAAIIILGIALGVGLGVGLNNNNKK